MTWSPTMDPSDPARSSSARSGAPECAFTAPRATMSALEGMGGTAADTAMKNPKTG